MLRNLPSVSELLETPPLRPLVHRVNRTVVVSRVRQFLDDMRTQVQSAAAGVHVPSAGELAQKIADWIASEEPELRPVVNATGLLLDGELGRAPLADEALNAMAAVGRGYSSLQIDLASGGSVSRTAAVERLLTRLTGAEAATVVNNNAAATLIALAALACGREVIASRGQLAEIGKSYRLPEMFDAGGAILRAVGTTNKTRIGDYAAAICPQTAALMRVHASSYAIVGCSAEASLDELIALARQRELPIIDVVGTGALMDPATYGIVGEQMPAQSIRAGADLVLFSGDKLLGGPQCGLIAGRQDLIDRINKHPLMRALRLDKLRLAALAATLRLFHDAELAECSVPIVTLLATPLENLHHRAQRLAPQLEASGVASVEIVTGKAYLSRGSLPSQAIPTICLALTPQTGTAEVLAAALRSGSPPVIGRIQDGRLLLDLRSVQPRDDAQIVAAVEALRQTTSDAGSDAMRAPV
jgi:L-seryl-tRNA(Ser) seleniumtransferase